MSTDKTARTDDLSELPAVPSGRIASVDTYRGAVMLLMMAEVLELAKVARSFPDSPTWQALAFHQSHVDWTGCSVHDMIQPSFSFLVGVALPFSLASRLRRGESWRLATLHAAWRAIVLVALGVLLRSIGRKMTNFTFEDTLSQIGLGYFPLFLIGMAPTKARWIALGAILVGYWIAFTVPNPLELLTNGHFQRQISDWRKKYSMIIIDTPPITEFADGLAIASFAEQVVIVGRVGSTPHKNMKEMLRRMAGAQSRIVGAVINSF